MVLLFLGPSLELANMQALLQIGSVAWEQLLGPVGCVALTSFLNEAFLLVDLNSFPIHDTALCRLWMFPAGDGGLAVLLAESTCLSVDK